MRNTILTAFSIITVALLGVGGFMQYNWSPDEKTPIMNAIIFAAILVSVFGRFTKSKRTILVIIIISDLTLILCSFRGIAYGKLISSIVNSIDFDYPRHLLLVVLALIIFIFDWRNRLLTTIR